MRSGTGKENVGDDPTSFKDVPLQWGGYYGGGWGIHSDRSVYTWPVADDRDELLKIKLDVFDDHRGYYIETYNKSLALSPYSWANI